jgi:hypothetical protein
MTEQKEIIHFNKDGFEHHKARAKEYIQLIQKAVSRFTELVNLPVEETDLPVIVLGQKEAIKTLVFDKLTKDNPQETIFGVKIKKEKALELLDVPDTNEVAEILRPALDGKIKSIPVEALTIIDGMVSHTNEYEELLRTQNTTYAITDKEKARLKAVKEITKILQDLHDNKVIDLRNFKLGSAIRTTDADEIIISHHWVKTGIETHLF